MKIKVVIIFTDTKNTSVKYPVSINISNKNAYIN